MAGIKIIVMHEGYGSHGKMTHLIARIAEVCPMPKSALDIALEHQLDNIDDAITMRSELVVLESCEYRRQSYSRRPTRKINIKHHNINNMTQKKFRRNTKK